MNVKKIKNNENDIKKRIISDADILLKMFCKTYGPNGKYIITNIKNSIITLQPNNKNRYIDMTTCSSVILDSDCFTSMLIMKILYPLYHIPILKYGDCGTFSLVFCLSLLKSTVNKSYHPIIVSNIYNQILEFCIKLFSTDLFKIEISWRKIEPLISLISSVISSKSSIIITNEELNEISTQLISSFIYCINLPNPKNGINFITTIGSLHPKIETHNSTIFIDIPLPLLYPKHYENCNVLLYDISIMSPKLVIEVENNLDYLFSMEESEENILLSIGNELIKYNIKILASQRIVHPFLKTFCFEHNILVLERLSIRYIELFHNISDAKIISRWNEEIEPSYIGRIDELNEVEIYSHKYIKIVKKRNIILPISTMIISACNTFELNEFKTIINQILSVLITVSNIPYVVSGGGCFESMLIKEIENNRKDVKGIEKDISYILIDSLKYTLANLWKVISDDVDDIIQQIILKNRITKDKIVLYGYDPVENDYFITLEASKNDNGYVVDRIIGVDCYEAKISMFEIAISTAITISRVCTAVLNKS